MYYEQTKKTEIIKIYYSTHCNVALTDSNMKSFFTILNKFWSTFKET